MAPQAVESQGAGSVTHRAFEFVEDAPDRISPSHIVHFTRYFCFPFYLSAGRPFLGTLQRKILAWRKKKIIIASCKTSDIVWCEVAQSQNWTSYTTFLSHVCAAPLPSPRREKTYHKHTSMRGRRAGTTRGSWGTEVNDGRWVQSGTCGATKASNASNENTEERASEEMGDEKTEGS